MLIGTVIERYKILEKLGAGGMGEVYRAQHTTIGQYVAIKQLLPSVAEDRSALDRFMQEAVAAARINDPGIVRVLDQLTAPDGTTFIIMELLEGRNLAARIEHEGRLALETAAMLARQIARAVAAAHRAGIIHRDLKPANIFLVADDDLQGGVRAKVLDFGLAKLVKRDKHAGPTTDYQTQMGTPAYMPPEQWRSSRDVDARADVYSLGCIFYEMICGRPPFSGTRDELQSQHEAAPVPPPSCLVSSLAPAADAVAARALAKKPGDRFADMDEFAVALGTMVGSADLDGTHPAQQRQPQRQSDTKRIGLALVSSALLIGLGISVFLWKAHQPAPPDLTVSANDAGPAVVVHAGDAGPIVVLHPDDAGPIVVVHANDASPGMRKSKGLLERCQQDDYGACAQLGQAVFAGHALSGDREKAVDLFQKACDGGEGLGCIGLGDVHAAEDLHTQAEAYYQQGEELLRVSCKGNSRRACRSLQQYLRKKGVQ
jgi:serine/threonine protein kinase